MPSAADRGDRWVAPALAVAIALACAATFYVASQKHARLVWANGLAGGDARRAPEVMIRYGCAGCHSIAGVPGAAGTVGPPLQGLADRAFIGGAIVNNPSNLAEWVRRSRDMVPDTAMPNTGATDQEARDMAAYLYALAD
ncbi:c-type cytochrome [Mesorhizobium sp. BR1-1-16]|uniref:c-type cytochrome n=1 Tax=Mesorhizobium sp. BR1-1-16 TaxID=2876653 RepID=UPI001CC9C988|nr:c-type cytochrome [Mesorhizobium sp. BR1-1-16]MBZ9936985.1 c-type cytochrome [Mesorhizobium sp. BR1-1-16]